MTKSIKVIYNDGINSLLNKLKRKKLEIEKLSSGEMVVHLKDSNEYNQFIEIVNKYLIKEYFEKATKKILQKKGYGNSFSEALMEVESIKKIDKVDYFNIVTEILLLEYFKSMSVINLSSFMLLNMKGFKEEATTVVELAEKVLKESLIEADGEGEEEGYVDDISTALATLIDNNELSLADFIEIKANVINDTHIELIDMKDKTYTLDSLSELIGFKIEGVFGEQPSEFEKSVLFICFICSIMGTRKLTIKRGRKGFKSMLTAYLVSMGLNVEVEEV